MKLGGHKGATGKQTFGKGCGQSRSIADIWDLISTGPIPLTDIFID